MAAIVANQTLLSPGDSPIDPPQAAPRSHRGAIIGIAVVAVLLIGASVVAGLAGRAKPRAWQGVVLDPAPAKPDFTLTDTSGHPYDFRVRTKGQLTFLYFGYTHCPDVCPITLATLSGALDDLSGVAATVVFVTTDPVRDTPARLRSWLDGYDTHFVGLTGTPAELAAAQKAAGVTVATANAPKANGSYTVGHAASVLAYTPDGREHLTFPFGITQAGWQHDIPKMLAVASWNGRS